MEQTIADLLGVHVMCCFRWLLFGVGFFEGPVWGLGAGGCDKPAGDVLLHLSAFWLMGVSLGNFCLWSRCLVSVVCHSFFFLLQLLSFIFLRHFCFLLALLFYPTLLFFLRLEAFFSACTSLLDVTKSCFNSICT